MTSPATCSPATTTTICSSRWPAPRTRSPPSVRAEIVRSVGEPGQSAGLTAQHRPPEFVGIARRRCRPVRSRARARLRLRSRPRADPGPTRRSPGTPGRREPRPPRGPDRPTGRPTRSCPVMGERCSSPSTDRDRRLGERDQRVLLDRPAREHRRRCGLQVDPTIERLVEALDRRAVDHHADRAVVVVFEDEDDGAIEMRVLERGRGDEQTALRRKRSRKHASPVCPIRPCHRPRGRSRTRVSVLHDHARFRMLMQMSSLRVGIIGASGFTGAELLRLDRRASRHGCSSSPPATRWPARRAADVYPSLEVAYPDLVFEAFDPAHGRGSTSSFLGLPHEASMALAPQLVGSVGCVVDLSAAYRLKDAAAYPDVLRLRAHPTRAARRGGVRPARTAPRRS